MVLQTRDMQRPGPVGQPVKRREDPGLLTGKGKFVDDIRLPGTLHVKFVRSGVAHARIRRIDASRAEQAEGVVLVLTAAQVNTQLKPLPVLWQYPGLRDTASPPLAEGKVLYAGEPLALLVATDPYLAEDAAALVTVEYAGLPAVIDAEGALAPTAPLLFDGWETNEPCPPIEVGSGDVAAAFRAADRIIAGKFTCQRVSGLPLEGRGCLAWPTPDGLTLYTSTQEPNAVQTVLSESLGIALHAVRVIAPDVGGGFGVKAEVYPEEILVAYAAMHCADRSSGSRTGGRASWPARTPAISTTLSKWR